MYDASLPVAKTTVNLLGIVDRGGFLEVTSECNARSHLAKRSCTVFRHQLGN